MYPARTHFCATKEIESYKIDKVNTLYIGGGTPTSLSDEGFEKMLSGFMEIRTGSSGSSLRSVQQAVKLLDWGTATDMNIDEIALRTSAFIQTMDGAVTESYIEQLTMLYETYRLLLTDGQEALLESAGCTDTAYPWGGAPIAGIEAIFETAGVI